MLTYLGMAYGNDPPVLPPLPLPTSHSTSATGVDNRLTNRLCRRLALITDVSAGTAMDVCASPLDGRRIVHAFLSAGPVVEVRLLRDTLGPLAAGPDAVYGRYFLLQYNGNLDQVYQSHEAVIITNLLDFALLFGFN